MNKQFFFYKKEGILIKVNFDEIIFIEADNNYARISTLDGYHMVRSTMDVVMSQLPKDRFVQIHRSYIVAVGKIEAIEKDCISMEGIPENKIPLSKKYYAGLLKRIAVIE